MKKLSILTTCLLASMTAIADNQPVVPVSPLGSQQEIGTPTVPMGVVEKALRAGSKTKASGQSTIKAMQSSYKPFVINVEPGINQLIPIAKGHYNRIVTPFDTPFINTVSEATIDAHKNVIYVATNDDYPVTLFISPDVDDESMALSLTLAPKKIPPIEASLKLSEETVSNIPVRHKAKKWEESQPYVDTIVTAMKNLALGDIPDGYAMSKIKTGDSYPTCLQKDMKYDFARGQFLRGHNFNIVIGTIQNTSDSVKEVDEYACIDGSIVAASAWPNTILEPGAKSEMYVIMKKISRPVISRKRKSLLSAEDR